MDDKEREYIVTEIEKANSNYKSSMIEAWIFQVCVIVFVVLNSITINGLGEDVDTIVNEILKSTVLLGGVGSQISAWLHGVETIYWAVKTVMLKNKLEKDNEDEEEIKISFGGRKTR